MRVRSLPKWQNAVEEQVLEEKQSRIPDPQKGRNIEHGSRKTRERTAGEPQDWHVRARRTRLQWRNREEEDWGWIIYQLD